MFKLCNLSSRSSHLSCRFVDVAVTEGESGRGFLSFSFELMSEGCCCCDTAVTEDVRTGDTGDVDPGALGAVFESVVKAGFGTVMESKVPALVF